MIVAPAEFAVPHRLHSLDLHLVVATGHAKSEIRLVRAIQTRVQAAEKSIALPGWFLIRADYIMNVVLVQRRPALSHPPEVVGAGEIAAGNVGAAEVAVTEVASEAPLAIHPLLESLQRRSHICVRRLQGATFP